MGVVIAYAARTGTRRNLDALAAAEWGLMISAMGEHRCEGFDRLALDNGAYSMWQAAGGDPSTVIPAPFAPETWRPFVALLDRFGSRADFAVCPDIPCQGRASLGLSLQWLPAVLTRTPRALIPVQNGIGPDDLASFVGPSIGVFIGGDAQWKEDAIAVWGPWCAQRGVWCHVGRVNTARRIRLCQLGQVTSFDGSSASRYATTLPMLDSARRQQAFRFAS